MAKKKVLPPPALTTDRKTTFLVINTASGTFETDGWNPTLHNTLDEALKSIENELDLASRYDESINDYKVIEIVAEYDLSPQVKLRANKIGS